MERGRRRRESEKCRKRQKQRGTEKNREGRSKRSLQLLIRSSRRLCDASGFIPVVALWLWCRSGSFTVPLGLRARQSGEQSACLTGPGDFFPFFFQSYSISLSHMSLSGCLSLLYFSAVSNSFSVSSALSI